MFTEKDAAEISIASFSSLHHLQVLIA